MQDNLAALIRRNTVAGGFANTVAIAKEAFEMGVKSAAPPAVEREGMSADRMALTDEDLVAWAEQAKRDDWHLRFVGSDIRQLIGQLQRARLSPTLHPSDREAIARIIDPNNWSLVDHYRRLVNRPELEARVPVVTAPSLAKAEAILALSGSLAPEGGEETREGPASLALDGVHCFGCIHLKTKDWREPSGDGETFDSGTSARCGKIPTEHGGQSISAYWSKRNHAPKWCPFLPPSTEKGETK